MMESKRNADQNWYEPVICLSRDDVTVHALAACGAWYSVDRIDDERLSLSLGCSPQESDARPTCTLDPRAGVLQVSRAENVIAFILRPGEAPEALSGERALLADGDAVWLISALDGSLPSRLPAALAVPPDARFHAVCKAMVERGEAPFAVIRLRLPGSYQTLRVPSAIDQCGRAVDFVSEVIEAEGCPPKIAIPFMTCLDDLFSNIVYYSGSPEAEIGCSVAGGFVSVRLSDTGKPFDPRATKQPDVTLSAEDRGIGGLGLFMVKKLMDSFEYERRDGRNITIIRKRIPASRA